MDWYTLTWDYCEYNSLRIIFAILKGFCALGILGKEGPFKGIAREIRNLCKDILEFWFVSFCVRGYKTNMTFFGSILSLWGPEKRKDACKIPSFKEKASFCNPCCTGPEQFFTPIDKACRFRWFLLINGLIMHRPSHPVSLVLSHIRSLQASPAILSETCYGHSILC